MTCKAELLAKLSAECSNPEVAAADFMHFDQTPAGGSSMSLRLLEQLHLHYYAGSDAMLTPCSSVQPWLWRDGATSIYADGYVCRMLPHSTFHIMVKSITTASGSWCARSRTTLGSMPLVGRSQLATDHAFRRLKLVSVIGDCDGDVLQEDFSNGPPMPIVFRRAAELPLSQFDCKVVAFQQVKQATGSSDDAMVHSALQSAEGNIDEVRYICISFLHCMRQPS